jgi:hypothetical protein
MVHSRDILNRHVRDTQEWAEVRELMDRVYEALPEPVDPAKARRIEVAFLPRPNHVYQVTVDDLGFDPAWSRPPELVPALTSS